MSIRVTIDFDSDIPLVREILHIVRSLQTQGATIMADLQALEAQVASVEAETAAQTEIEASAATLLNQLSDLIRANATDPAALQALADRLSSATTAGGSSNAALVAAVTANTPAAAPPVP